MIIHGVCMKELFTKIEDRKVIIGIIGQGYVGLPLAMAYSKEFRVYGYDISEEVIGKLKRGKSHIQDVSDAVLTNMLQKKYLPTSDSADLRLCDVIIICVPTPLTEDKLPDMSYIKSACNTICTVLHKGQFIILESTTYPGTTNEVVIPMLEKTGLKAGMDFGVAYSPERVDPGNVKFSIDKIPTIVGGINAECTDIAAALYGAIVDTVVPVSDARTAESVKMVENIFRNVNIALVNEMALIFERMGINTWEVIEAAATKPYGYMPFYPGPGIGGHCIPLDPFYMSYKAKKFGFIPRFIDTSAEINEYMKVHVVNLIERGLNKKNKKINGAKITIMGLAYKKNIGDTRESPAIKIIEEIVNLGGNVRVYDPHARSIITKAGEFFSVESIDNALTGAECSVFITDHNEFSTIHMEKIIELMDTPIVIDTKNIFSSSAEIVYLGIGKG